MTTTAAVPASVGTTNEATRTHDLIVIGSGSGNSVITDEMDDWHIALVEEGALGGTCLNRGCIPTKMFVYAANVAHSAATSDKFGLDTQFNRADWPAIRDRIFGRIDPIAVAGRDYRESLDNVDLYPVRARFVGHGRLQVADEVISSDRIVLAAGSHAVVPEIPGLDEVAWHTSDTIMRLDRLPEHLVIVGGGFIAVELAHVFAAFGSRVTMLVRGDEMLRGEDPEVSARVTRAYQRRVDLRLGTNATNVVADGDDIRVTTTDGDEVVGDVLLLATGRHPNGASLGVDETGVAMDAQGYVEVDQFQRTNVEGIWALGDISSPAQLKHKANADARLVAHNLVHPDDLQASNLGPVPHAVFGLPEVASVGLTEPEAIAAGIDHVAVVHEFSGAAYGWAMEDETSAVKLVVARDTRLLLGAHIVGPQAPTLIQVLIQGMQFGQTVDELGRDQWWIHPALPEVVEQALLAV